MISVPTQHWDWNIASKQRLKTIPIFYYLTSFFQFSKIFLHFPKAFFYCPEEMKTGWFPVLPPVFMHRLSLV